MLLLIALTLKGAIAISPTPPPPTPTPSGGGGSSYSYSSTYRDIEKENRDRLQKILIEDSELIKIVELTLKHFII